MAALAMTSSVSTVEMVVTAWREEVEYKKGKVKEFRFFKQVGFVLERGNKFFLGRKEGNLFFTWRSRMIFLWKNNILWCRKNKSWRFKLDDDINFFLGI